MRKVIAIDFDGTLFETQYPTILSPRKDVIDRALEEQRNGAALILWTCREGEHLRAALDACKEQGLVFDAVNESLVEWVDAWGNDPRKIGATEYWDDRAVHMGKDTIVPTTASLTPLTPEELRWLDGKPVWIEDRNDPENCGWTIWETERQDEVLDEEYGKSWAAYAHEMKRSDLHLAARIADLSVESQALRNAANQYKVLLEEANTANRQLHTQVDAMLQKTRDMEYWMNRAKRAEKAVSDMYKLLLSVDDGVRKKNLSMFRVTRPGAPENRTPFQREMDRVEETHETVIADIMKW